MGVVMGVMAAASAGVTLANAYNESEAIKAEGEYQKKISDLNARFADMQYEDALERGKRESEIKAEEVRQMLGRQRAIAAAQGVSADSGSVADIRKDTATYGLMDVMTIKNNAIKEAYGFKSQASSFRAQGEAAYSGAQFKSRNTLITGGLTAINTGMSAYYHSNSGGGRKSVPTTGGKNAGGSYGNTRGIT